MKLFKIIMNCVIATLFIASIIFNIFVLSGFRIVDTNTYTPEINEPQNEQYEAQNEPNESNESNEPNKPNEHDIIKPNKHEVNKENECEKLPVEEPVEEPIKDLVYQDNNITVFFCGLKEDFTELTYQFEIKNTSSTPLNIVFDDLIIDGERVYVSGLTCEKLLPGNTSVEDFVVKEFDGSQNENIKREFKFNIKLMNAKSYLDLYETEQVTVIIL